MLEFLCKSKDVFDWREETASRTSSKVVLREFKFEVVKELKIELYSFSTLEKRKFSESNGKCNIKKWFGSWWHQCTRISLGFRIIQVLVGVTNQRSPSDQKVRIFVFSQTNVKSTSFDAVFRADYESDLDTFLKNPENYPIG